MYLKRKKLRSRALCLLLVFMLAFSLGADAIAYLVAPTAEDAPIEEPAAAIEPAVVGDPETEQPEAALQGEAVQEEVVSVAALLAAADPEAKDYKAATAAGRAPILPARVVVDNLRFDTPTATAMNGAGTYNYAESFESSLVPVVWDLGSFTAADYAADKIGTTFSVDGVTAPGSRAPGLAVKAVFTVNEPVGNLDHNYSVSSGNVIFDDVFWAPKQAVTATTTFDHSVRMLESTNDKRYAVQNMKNAIGRLERVWADGTAGTATFYGNSFQDTDVHKALEGFSYTLATIWNDDSYTAERKSYMLGKLKEYINYIATIQYADGYVNSYFSTRRMSHRWMTLGNHEMYNMGHLLEAVVAYTQFSVSVGENDYTMYEIGRRIADHMASVFGPGGYRTEITGHPEIELALMRFVDLCEQYEGMGAGQKYRDTVETFIYRYGRSTGEYTRQSGSGSGGLDATPLENHTIPLGHSVRAMYFYHGANDIAYALPTSNPNKQNFSKGILNVYDTLSERLTYITGGLGSGETSEGFGADWHIRNNDGYTEVCAAIAGANLYRSLNLYYEDAQYADAFERALYNGVTVGVTLEGNNFAYQTRLDQAIGRAEWQDCACCMCNLIRTIANASSYMYTVNKDKVFVNTYGGSTGKVSVQGDDVVIEQESNYPWEGAVKLTVSSAAVNKEFTLNLRIPGWVKAQKYQQVTVLVNGQAIDAVALENKGYVPVTINTGSPAVPTVIEMDIPMEVRVTEGDINVTRVYSSAADRYSTPQGQWNKVVVERGPIVYMVEPSGVPNGDPASATTGRTAANVRLPRDMKGFQVVNRLDGEDKILRGVYTIEGYARFNTATGPRDQWIQLIPYYTKGNRGGNPQNTANETSLTAPEVAKIWLNATENDVLIRGNKNLLYNVGSDLAVLKANPKVNAGGYFEWASGTGDNTLYRAIAGTSLNYTWEILKGGDVIEQVSVEPSKTDDRGPGKIGGLNYTFEASTATYKGIAEGIATVQVTMKDAGGAVLAVDTYDIVVGGKGELKVAIAAFDALVAADYNSSHASYAAAQEARTAAQTTYANAAAATVQINAATAALLTAMDDMVLTIAGKAGLLEVINKAKARKDAPEAWAPYGYARMVGLLESAQTLYDSAAATAGQAKASASALQNELDAMMRAGFVESDDLPALKALLGEARAKEERFYYPASFAPLVAAITNGAGVLQLVDEGNCPKADFDAAAAQLTGALAGLVENLEDIINLTWMSTGITIYNGISNLAIEANGGTNNVGGTIDVWATSNDTYKGWQLVPDANQEYFQIRRNVANGRALSAPVTAQGEYASGTAGRLTLADPSDTANNQWWKLELDVSGRYLITNKAFPMMCIAPETLEPINSNRIILVPLVSEHINTWTFNFNPSGDPMVPTKPIRSAVAPNISVVIGTSIDSINLPDSIPVAYLGNTTAERKITWDTGSYNGSLVGEYTLAGTIALEGIDTNPNEVTASITIEVEPEPIQEKADYYGATAAGRAPILPRRVVVDNLIFDTPSASVRSTVDTLKWSGDNRYDFGESFTSSLVPVVWDMDSFSAADYAAGKIGTKFVVNGITAPGSRAPGLPVRALFAVNEPLAEIDYNHSITSGKVIFEDVFWAPKQATNAEVIFGHAVDMLESALPSRHTVQNYKNAASRLQRVWAGETPPNATRYGFVFQDSDLYKTMEGFAYSLASQWDDPDFAAERDKHLAKMKEWILLIEAVQYADGYVNTNFSTRGLSHRWRTFGSHEMYVMGHMLEAVVPFMRFLVSIGDNDYTFYEIGRRVADHHVNVFGPDGYRVEVPGHPEIEMALMKFADLCEEFEGAGAGQKYRDTVETIVNRRGRRTGEFARESGYSGGTSNQDATPLVNETRAVGHAVRAMYFYTGATDVAISMPDTNPNKEAFLRGINSIYDMTSERNSYITGGVGSGETSESFGDDWHLRNFQAYTEVCASIAAANWYQRLNLYNEDAKYADSCERVVYNGVLAGRSLDGNKFYYGTAFDSRGAARYEWQDCACCPPSMLRTLANISGYMYTVNKDKVFVNMYGGSTGKFDVKGKEVEIKQETNYPWDGAVKLTVKTAADAITLYLRIPGWVKAQKYQQVTILVNGVAIDSVGLETKGYVPVSINASATTVVEMDIPIEVRFTEGDINVARVYSSAADRYSANAGQWNKVIVERGPVVYMLETPGVPNGDPATATDGRDARQVYIPRDMDYTETWNPGLLRGVVEITGMARFSTAEGPRDQFIQLTPFYAKENRGNNPQNDGMTTAENTNSFRGWLFATDNNVLIRGNRNLLKINDEANLKANPKVSDSDFYEWASGTGDNTVYAKKSGAALTYEWEIIKGQSVIEIVGAPAAVQTDDKGPGKIGGLNYTFDASAVTYKGIAEGVATVQVTMKNQTGAVLAVDTYDIVVGEKGALKAAIAAFDALSASDFTAASYAAAKAVRDTANTVYGNVGALPKQIDAQTAALLAAMEEMAPTASGKAGLLAVINLANAKAADGYAPNGYARMETLRDAAQTAYDNAATTVAQANAAAAALQNQLDTMRAAGLAEYEDLPALYALLDKAVMTNDKYYTAESFADLQAAVALGRAALTGVDKGTCAKAAFDEAVANLNAAFADLVDFTSSIINLPWMSTGLRLFSGDSIQALNANGNAASTTVNLWQDWGHDDHRTAWRLIPDANNEYFRIQKNPASGTGLMLSAPVTSGAYVAYSRLALAAVDATATADRQWWKLEFFEGDPDSGQYLFVNKLFPNLCMSPSDDIMHQPAHSTSRIVLMPVETATLRDTWRVTFDWPLAATKPVVSKPVRSVESVPDITVPLGTPVSSIELPDTLTVQFMDNTKANREITWNTEGYNANASGIYTLTGTFALDGIEVNPNNAKASIAITVGSSAVSVRFEREDGSLISVVDVPIGEPVPKPAGPERFGYTFAGWNLGDKPYDFEAPVAEAITLVTQWTRNPITSLQISNTQGIAAPALITVARNSKVQFDYIVNPDALREGIVWSVSNASYATVDEQTGQVAIKSVTGTVILTAKDPLNGATQSIVLRIV